MPKNQLRTGEADWQKVQDALLDYHPCGVKYQAQLVGYISETIEYATPPLGDANLKSITYSCFSDHSPRIVVRTKVYRDDSVEGETRVWSVTEKALGDWDNRATLTGYVPFNKLIELTPSDPEEV